MADDTLVQILNKLSEITPPEEPASEPEQPESPSERFEVEGVDVSTLDDRNREIYLKLQRAYTKKTQKLAERQKEVENLKRELEERLAESTVAEEREPVSPPSPPQSAEPSDLHAAVEQIALYLLQREAESVLLKESEKAGVSPEDVISTMNQFGLNLTQVEAGVQLTKLLQSGPPKEREETQLPEFEQAPLEISAKPGDSLVDIASRIPGYNLKE